MLLTVRRPGARIAPISSTSACRQLRCWKTSAKHRITAAKRAGRRSMVVVLWRGRYQPSRSSAPPPRPTENGQSRAWGQTLKIKGELHYLWRAVDQHGVVLDILVQDRRNATAAKRFFKRLLTGLKYKPKRIVTDGLRSYGVAHREILPEVKHRTS
jgi:transposase-like protein